VVGKGFPASLKKERHVKKYVCVVVGDYSEYSGVVEVEASSAEEAKAKAVEGRERDYSVDAVIEGELVDA
jgi:hypothetical protein